MPKKTAAAPSPKKSGNGGDAGTGLYGLAPAVESIAEELRPLYHLETLADNVGGLESPLNKLADAVALSIIAQYGEDEDRAAVVAKLKGWFDDFGR